MMINQLFIKVVFPALRHHINSFKKCVRIGYSNKHLHLTQETFFCLLCVNISTICVFVW